MTNSQQRRWYDQDPLLSDAMKTLKNASDAEQIRLALHVVKILNEHNLEKDDAAQEQEREDGPVFKYSDKKSRWYDLDNTLKTSIEMLRCCDLETQKLIAGEIVELLQSYGEDQ